MALTTNPEDPRLGRGSDAAPAGMNAAYLVLPEEDRAKGFVRPVRRSYKHVGPAGHSRTLRDLSAEEAERFAAFGYVKFEPYPETELPVTGRYWTQVDLDRAQAGGCGAVTTMAQAIAETYARDPKFYGATFCATCQTHRPVAEFLWVDDNTTVGS